MGNTPLILHQYDISPFSQKAQKMMGLKGLSWQSVEMPMIAPKPDVEALTGGYRGTPVLQIGGDVYVDNWMIARALDHVSPKTPLINARGPLHDGAIYAWSERLFTPLLHSALAAYKDQWDANFLADRKRVFPDVDFDALEVHDVERLSQIRAYLGVINAELKLREGFLGGERADSWDIHVWGLVWMIKSALPGVLPVVDYFPALMQWYDRMTQIGTGHREDAEIEVAWRALKSYKKRILPPSDRDEPLYEWVGRSVTVLPGSADRGGAQGRLAAVDYEQAVLVVEPWPGIEAQVWFPRFGYHIRKCRTDEQTWPKKRRPQ